MTLTLPATFRVIKKIHSGYKKILSLIRCLPEGLFYSASFACALLIASAGAQDAPFENVQSAFNVFFFLHFVLCVRLGLSITSDEKQLPKMVWLFGLTSICIGMFNSVFEPSALEFAKLCIYLNFLVAAFFYIGVMFSAFAEDFKPTEEKPSTADKFITWGLLILTALSVIIGPAIGEQIALMLREYMGLA